MKVAFLNVDSTQRRIRYVVFQIKFRDLTALFEIEQN